MTIRLNIPIDDELYDQLTQLPGKLTEKVRAAQIELSTNAKGQHQWSIKLYGEEMDSGLLEKVLKIDGELSEKYKDERDVK